MSTDSQDTALLTNINRGSGLTAIEAKYHLTCLTKLGNIGIILLSDKEKTTVNKRRFIIKKELQYVGTWSNYDTCMA